jgi:hypothetical protein
MRYLLVPLLFIFAPLCWPEADAAGKTCAHNYGAKLVSLQGKLFFDPDSKGHWQPGQLNETICEGSRASLLLPDNVVLRLDAGTVLSLNGIAPSRTSGSQDFRKDFRVTESTSGSGLGCDIAQSQPRPDPIILLSLINRLVQPLNPNSETLVGNNPHLVSEKYNRLHLAL